MKIQMLVELKCDDNMIDFTDEEERDWFYNDILKSKRKDLFLHSNEVGDEVGTIKVLGILN